MANNLTLSYPSSFYHQFFDRNGKPLTSGKLYTYIAGSTTPAVTYKTISGGTESANRNTNPIILDMAGMAELVISTDNAYKFVLFDRNDVKIDEWDDVTAGASDGGSSLNVDVVGTDGEIDVQEESVGLIRRFIVSLSDSVKNAISNLSSSVNNIIIALNNKKDKQQPVFESGSTTKVPVSFAQDANGVLDIEFEDITFPDWTTAINNAVANCENTLNKKNSVTGYESSTSAYPSIKAVVDFVNNALQNLGGKLITDNGNPFSDSNDLPSTTPYQGVTISDKDYAYVQGTGYAERWSASVSGSDVIWVQEYSINIPVFTPAQQAAIDSGATATKISSFDLHIANTTIHVTSTEKNTWNAKQNAIGDLAEIRSGAAAGATALQPSGNGSNVTSTFTTAISRTNISSGEKLSTIFGKIAKWFADLKAVAFSGSYNDLSNTPTIPTELPVKIEEIGGSSVDLDSLTASDMKVHYYTWSNGNRGNVIHKPTDAVYTIKVFPCGSGSAGTYVMQEAYKRGTTERYVRRRSDGGTSWSDWQLCTYSNESYPNMGVGTATHLGASARLDTWSSTYDENNPFVLAAEITWELGTSKNNGAGQLLQFDFANSNYALIRLNYITKGNNINTTKAVVLNSNFSNSELSDLIRITHFKYDSDTKFAVRVYIKFTGNWQVWSIRQLDAQSGDEGYTNWVPMTLYNVHGSNVASPTGTSATYVFPLFALKAPSGNGNLAVIDPSGNYASSGISAYSQSQLNANVENNVFPWLLDNSYLMTRSFFLTATTSVTGKVMDFVNLYTGEKLLRIGFNYVNDGDLQIYIPWNNAQWNQWIIETSGTSEVGYVFVTANGTKHSDNAGADTITPYFAQNESTLHSSGQSVSIVGNYSIGTSTLYNTSSHYNFCIMLGNAESGKLVRLNLSAATKRYASGAKKAEIMVFATLDASGLND